jgi:hypothetical protein
MNIPKEKFNFFTQRVGFSIEDLVNDINIPELSCWINNVSGRSKGFAGEIFEWMITGRQGDNEPKPDFEGVEIKACSYDEKRKKFIEKISLTAVSYSTIENETFETSRVLHKSQIFVIKLTKNTQNPLHRKFLGFGKIDLKKHYNQIKDEYNYYRNLVCEGKANKFTSSAKVLGENQILHVRTAGTRKYKSC